MADLTGTGFPGQGPSIAKVYKNPKIGIKDGWKACQLLGDTRFCTTVLLVGPNRERIVVNPYILALCSEFFYKHFNSSNLSQPVELLNLDPDVVQLLVKYMHTGMLTILQDDVFKIMVAAEKFELQDLKLECIRLTTLTARNCLRLRKLSIENEMDDLTESCEAFLKNNFETVSECPAFLNLDYEEVQNVIAIYLTQPPNNEVLLNAIIKWTEKNELQRNIRLPKLITKVNLNEIYDSNLNALLDAFSSGKLLAKNPECNNMFIEVLKSKAQEKDLEWKRLNDGRGDDAQNNNLNNCTNVCVNHGGIPTSPHGQLFKVQLPVVTLKALDPVNLIGSVGQNGLRKRKSQEKPATTTTSKCRSSSSNPVATMTRSPTVTTSASRKSLYQTSRRSEMSYSVTGKRFIYPCFRDEKSKRFIYEYNFDTKSSTMRHKSRSWETRRFSTLVHFGDKIFEIGGSEDRYFPVDSSTSSSLVLEYHKEELLSKRRLNLLESSKELAACICANHLYVVGGSQKKEGENASLTINCAERLHLIDSSAVFEEIDFMNYSRGTHDLAVLGNKIYAVGGIGFHGGSEEIRAHALASVEVFDCELPNDGRDNWNTVDEMNEARAFVKTAIIGDKIYAVGGRARHRPGEGLKGETLKSVESYIPGRTKWENCPSMHHSRCNGVVFEHNNLLYALGGNLSEPDSSMEVFDPRINQWILLKWPEMCVDLGRDFDFNSGIIIRY